MRMLRVEIQERIKELTQDLREEPNHNSNHMASMIAGEIDGLKWVIERIDERCGTPDETAK